jgi:hypothetical protein
MIFLEQYYYLIRRQPGVKLLYSKYLKAIQEHISNCEQLDVLNLEMI